jgi:hypothetical protein
VSERVEKFLDSQLVDKVTARMQRLQKLAESLQALLDTARSYRQHAERILVECCEYRHRLEQQLSDRKSRHPA